MGRNRVPDAAVVSLGTVQRHTAPGPDVGRFVEENDLRAIHDGERESLYLCATLQVHLVLSDDLAVRAATRLNVTPVGSLGIVARAHRRGQLSLAEAERCMTDLASVSSLFVTPIIVELAIEQLRRHGG